MSQVANQYYNPVPPILSTTPGVGITWLATSVTSTAFDLGSYPDLFGKYLDLYADGGKIWIAFSPATATISKASTPGASIAAGTLGTTCVPIAANGVLTVRLDLSGQRWLIAQADAGTPNLILVPSSQPRLY
jgi:hypothetical protein